MACLWPIEALGASGACASAPRAGDSSEDNDDDGHHHDGHDEEEDEELLEAEHEEQVVASLGPAVRISYEPALTAVFNATQAPGLAVRDLVKLVPHRCVRVCVELWRGVEQGGRARARPAPGAGQVLTSALRCVWF